MYPFITANVADEHLRDLLREAQQSRAADAAAAAAAGTPRRTRRRRTLSWRLMTARTANA